MKHRDHTQPLPGDTQTLWPALVVLAAGILIAMACLKIIIPHLDKRYSSPPEHRRTAP